MCSLSLTLDLSSPLRSAVLVRESRHGLRLLIFAYNSTAVRHRPRFAARSVSSQGCLLCCSSTLRSIAICQRASVANSDALSVSQPNHGIHHPSSRTENRHSLGVCPQVQSSYGSQPCRIGPVERSRHRITRTGQELETTKSFGRDRRRNPERTGDGNVARRSET